MIEEISLAQQRALSERLSLLDTERLLEMWSNEERMVWADLLLQKELVKRGCDPYCLLEIKAARPKDFVYDSKIDNEWTLRIGTALLSIIAGAGIGAATNSQVGLSVGTLLFLPYTVHLLIDLGSYLRARASFLAKLYAIWDAISISAIPIFGIFYTANLIFSRA